MPTPDVLDTRIRSLVAELIESAPQAPVLPELDWTDTEHLPAVTRSPRPRRRARFVVAGFAGAVAAVLLVVGLIPVVAQTQHHQAAPTAPALADGQWLYSEQQASLNIQVDSVGNTPTPAAQALVQATIKTWASPFNQVCVSITARPATFASATNRNAWHTLRLFTTPSPNPWTACVSSGGGPTAPPEELLMNASRMPTERSALAQVLSKGTTGIPVLDAPNSELTGYERASLLLIGPTIGNRPAFFAALSHALPLIPGVRALGRMTSHTGTSGIGFATNSPLGRSILIVNPKTGTLLEAQNLYPAFILDLNDGLADQYIPETIAAKGDGTRITVQWIDPLGSPTIVGSHALPGDLTIPPVVTYSASIVALVKPTVTGNQVPDLKLSNASCRGREYSASARSQDQGQATPITTYNGTLANFPATLTYYCHGSPAHAAVLAKALKATGLFSSVVVTYANIPPTTSP